MTELAVGAARPLWTREDAAAGRGCRAGRQASARWIYLLAGVLRGLKASVTASKHIAVGLEHEVLYHLQVPLARGPMQESHPVFIAHSHHIHVMY